MNLPPILGWTGGICIQWTLRLFLKQDTGTGVGDGGGGASGEWGVAVDGEQEEGDSMIKSWKNIW